MVERDACDVTIVAPPHAVSIAFGNNPGGGQLSGSTTMTTVPGEATFADLVVNRPGAAYTLVATASGLASVTSGSFTVAGTPSAVQSPK